MMQMSTSTPRAKAPVAQASSPLHVLATLVCEGDAALDVDEPLHIVWLVLAGLSPEDRRAGCEQ